MQERIYKYTLVETINFKTQEEKIAVVAVAGRAKQMQFILPHRFDNYDDAEVFCDKIEKDLPLPTTRQAVADYISRQPK